MSQQPFWPFAARWLLRYHLLEKQQLAYIAALAMTDVATIIWTCSVLVTCIGSSMFFTPILHKRWGLDSYQYRDSNPFYIFL